jgi:transposase InsO family protein
MTEVPVAEHGKLHLQTVIDLYSRRLLGAAISCHPDRFLACSAIDIAVAEAFFSSPEWEVLSRTQFKSLRHAEAVVLDWCYGFYTHKRRHTHNQMLSPIAFEQQTQARAA